MNNNTDNILSTMYEVFKNYDLNENFTQEDIDDKFIEMMSDYKNYNKLMNAAFSIDESILGQYHINESEITNKSIVYNIKKFGPTYKHIYEAFTKCFEYVNPKTFNAEELKQKNAWNYLIDWYNANHNTNKDELKVIINMFMQNPDISSDGIKNALDTFRQLYKDSISHHMNEDQWNDMLNIFMQKIDNSEDPKKFK